MRTLTCLALRAVSANVHMSDGRKMATAQAHRLTAGETPPLDLNHVVMPLKTAIEKKERRPHHMTQTYQYSKGKRQIPCHVVKEASTLATVT